MTTGIGTTSAGLTVAAFKEGGEYILEAGALVLADCGVCTIDEFSLLKKEDRGSIHEAMEQQTISVAKAGIVCRINTRTTIIAATNPVGKDQQKWDPNCDLLLNTGIISSLLSRFDLIFILVDEHLPQADSLKATHTLMKQCISDYRTGPKVRLWSDAQLCEYINFIQKVFEPVVTEEAEALLRTYYGYLRQNPRVSKDRKSVRMLESLIRLSEAHARLLMKSSATVFDAVSVIVLMEHSLQTCLFGAEPPPAVVFADVSQYLDVKNAVFYRLGLDTDDFQEDWQHGEIDKRERSPSPIRRLEESMFLAGRDAGGGLDMTHTSMLDESMMSLHPKTNAKRALFTKPTISDFQSSVIKLSNNRQEIKRGTLPNKASPNDERIDSCLDDLSGLSGSENEYDLTKLDL